MERVLNLNTNQVKQAIYRGLTPLGVKEEGKFNKINYSNTFFWCLEGTAAYAGLTLDKLFGK